MNGITGTDIGSMLVHASSLFGALELLIRSLVGVVGFVLFISAVRMAIKISNFGSQFDSQHGTPGRVAAHIILSVLLFKYSIFMPGMWNSLFGGGGHSGIYSYTMVAAPGPYAAVITACLQFVQLIGWYFGYKGLMDWKHASDGQAQPGLVSKGAVHVFGGLACIHIGDFLAMVVKKLVGG